MGFVLDEIKGLFGGGSRGAQMDALESQSELARQAAELARAFEEQAGPTREEAFAQIMPLLERGMLPPVDVSGLQDTANPFRSQFSIDPLANVPPLGPPGGGRQAQPRGGEPVMTPEGATRRSAGGGGGDRLAQMAQMMMGGGGSLGGMPALSMGPGPGPGPTGPAPSENSVPGIGEVGGIETSIRDLFAGPPQGAAPTAGPQMPQPDQILQMMRQMGGGI